jgi:DNA-binding protein Fis
MENCSEVAVNSDELKNELEKTLERLIKIYIIMSFTDAHLPLKSFLNEVEKNLIDVALMVCNGSQKQASLMLGLKASCLCEKMKKFRLNKKHMPRYDLNILRELESEGDIFFSG